jgi:hypothetical protein
MLLGQTLLVTAGLDWVQRDGGEWLAGRRPSDRVLGACSRSEASSVACGLRGDRVEKVTVQLDQIVPRLSFAMSARILDIGTSDAPRG